MTKNSEFKQRVRERMQRTGERYTAARAQLLGKGQAAAEAGDYPGLLPGYETLGGAQSDTALLGRVLAHAGLRHPATGEPYSEAMLHGLCGGGVGFLYAVFEYKGHAPMLTVVMRSRSVPETYLADVFDRVGAERSVSRTTSARVAAKALDDALEAGQPAVCTVDLALLPHTKLPGQEAGMCPHYVGVIGRDGDRVWLDDRSVVPIAIGRAELDQARAAYRKAKHELFTVAAGASEPDWERSLEAALRDTVQTMREGDPTVPPYFRSNCGLAGMEKWRRLLVDSKDKKGWPRVFAGGADALAGLRRAYDGIQHEYTAARGGRPLYAEFLDEAANLTGEAALAEVAGLFREAGEGWQALADCIAGAPDDAVARACRVADRRTEALDSGGDASAKDEPIGECALDADQASELYARMADRLETVIDVETRAVDRLAKAL